MARSFNKPQLSPIPDAATRSALRPIVDYLIDIDGLIGANFNRSGQGGSVVVLQPTGTAAFDHGLLTGLGDDDHAQYLLLAGRAGGQSAKGGTAASENLTLSSTANATKGKLLFGTSAYDEVNNRLGIGTTSPGALFDAVIVNNVADLGLRIKAKASQTGDLIELNNSNSRNIAKFNSAGNLLLGNSTDTSVNSIIRFGSSILTSDSAGPAHTIITWGDNLSNLSDPSCTADMVGVAGARFYPFKDPTGLFDTCYGQSGTDAWVMVSDETIPYSFWTGVMSGTTFMRCKWDGNGDFTNFGFLYSRKSTGAGTKGVPGIRLEETGAGTDFIKIQAPAAVAAGSRLQTLLDMNGTIPLVGDDPPAVASKAMGKVDRTGEVAAITSVNLTNGATVGMYRVTYELADTTADATKVGVLLQLNITHTDDAGAKTQSSSTLVVTAVGSTQGVLACYLASGELAYTVTLTGGVLGTAAYAVRIRVEFLG